MLEIALRGSGLVLVLGAVLFGTTVVLVALRPVERQLFSPGVSLLMLLAAVALLLSLPAMYAQQAGAAGWLGLAGHVLLQAGLVLLVLLAATPLLHPALKVAAGEHPVVFVLGIALTLGLLLTGVATLRAGVFPAGAGWLLLAATAGFFFVFFVAEFLPPITGQIGSALFGVLLALALAWIGVALWISPAALAV
ncbi:MAG: hypothetical protein IT317_10210 [Anaerolineales bacterium]|nr:hypothetical protein [Anaerolineales bacterium]